MWTQHADCTPYLLQLGMTKSRMSLVWIAGPLSGLIMQPVVGILADRSRSRWGRRRPFMIGGALAVAACFLLLGWTSEIVGIFIQDAERVGGLSSDHVRARSLWEIRG
jgi:solute carrier family 45 protein 1/2/4